MDKEGHNAIIGLGNLLRMVNFENQGFHEAVEYGGQTGGATDHSQIQELLGCEK